MGGATWLLLMLVPSALLAVPRPSVWSGAALLLLLAGVTRRLRAGRAQALPAASEPAAAAGPFVLVPDLPGKALRSSVLAAALLQLGVWVGATGSPAEAFVYIAVALVWLAWRWPDRAAPLSRREAMCHAALAAMLLAGALLPRYLVRGEASSSSATASASSSAPHYAPPPPPKSAGDPVDYSGSTDGSLQAVVLWPKELPKTMLVAPLPAVSRRLLELRRRVVTQPLSIPFYGAYGFLRPPHR